MAGGPQRRRDGSVMEIVGDRVTVGSSPNNGIHLAHPSVGETHALIRGRNGGYSLAHLASRTGTWVNGRIEAGAILKDGSRISMGTSELFFSKLRGDDPQSSGGASASDGVLLVRSGYGADLPDRTRLPGYREAAGR